MHRKVMAFGAAIAVVAVATPAARANEVTALCRGAGLSQQDVTGTQAVEGVVVGYAEPSVSVWCEVRVNGVVASWTEPGALADDRSVTAGRVTFAGTYRDYTELCAVWQDPSGWRGEQCERMDWTVVPPYEVYPDSYDYAFEQVDRARRQPLLCLLTLPPSEAGAARINGEGDVFVGDVRVYDCPSYDEPLYVEPARRDLFLWTSPVPYPLP